MVTRDDLAVLDATAQAALVKSGEVSATELVAAAIERIEAVDPSINSVTTRLFDRAIDASRQLGLADRPFGGVPIVVKDVTPAAGEPCFRGMRLLRDLSWVEDHDSNVSSQLRRAGFIVVGRSNLPELAGGISTEPLAHGPCRNPWELDHSVGGSSGGSAAAVAAGLVPLAHGTDGGGSVRIPASLCGVVGLKPTRGRVSAGPDFTDTEGFSVSSVLTRSVRDTAGAIDAIAGAFPGDPWYAPPLVRPLADAMTAPVGALRIGMWAPSPSFHSPVHADCTEACEQAARLLEAAGHTVEASYPSVLDAGLPASFFALATSLIAFEVADVAAKTGRPVSEADVEPVIWHAGEAGRGVTAVRYQEAVADVRSYVRRFAEWWASGWDLVLTPTVAVPPYRLGATSPSTPDQPWPDVQPWIPFTPLFNLSGQPAISLPLSWNSDGLPVGVQLGASLGREDLLIAVAAQLEGLAPWAQRWPPHSYPERPTERVG